MTCGDFIGNLLHAVTIAHVMHLRQSGPGSYARHKALEELYEGLQDSVDELAEAYQGSYGLIQNYPAEFAMPDMAPGPITPPTEAADWVKGLSRFVQAGRGDLPQDSELQNIVDEIQGLIDRSHYRLSFLG